MGLTKLRPYDIIDLSNEREVTKMRTIENVRRIDDLGRIVIPKEIRRALRIKEGDMFEIFIGSDEGDIVLCKHTLEDGENSCDY